MGEEDYMFLPSVRKVVESHYKSSQLFIVANCGHVVNVEKPNIFNEAVLSFLKETK
jgi:pimeloyl-ACP methyl ester carboxylesterase